MAWANSYVVSSTLRDGLNNDVAVSLKAAYANLKIALYNNSISPSIDTDPQSYTVSPWLSTAGGVTDEEFMTSGSWLAGGVALSLTATGLTRVATVGVMFDAVDVSVANTTIASPGAYGCLIYDNSLTPKAAICAIYFGGSPYSTNNGTFGITWDTNGVFRITLHP